MRRRTGVPAVILADAWIAVAPDCELACAGCYALPGARRSGTRGSVRPARAVDEAAALGATAIHLIGKGEPLAPRARAGRGERAPSPPGRTCSSRSPRAASASRYDVVAALRDAKNVFVFVSVDGPPEAHAERRGEGAFDAVRSLMSRLRARRIPFGFSTMVSRAAIPAIADPELIASLASEGCLLGVYVRYFPLSPGRAPSAPPAPLRRERRGESALERLRGVAPIPLVDLDELEEESGCRSRLDRTLYIDAIHGAVTPACACPSRPPRSARLARAAPRHHRPPPLLRGLPGARRRAVQLVRGRSGARARRRRGRSRHQRLLVAPATRAYHGPRR